MAGDGARRLAYVEPMLAAMGEPFDSDEHLFEVKWDGFRALALVDADGLRLTSRRQLDLTPRFKDLAFLAAHTPGLALDGEIVALTADGRPDFERLLSKRPGPVVFIAFDLLARDFVSCQRQPLVERRERLREVVEAVGHPQLALSDGVVGAGRAFFAQLTAREFEGVVAKRLRSVYEPGQRSGAWLKIKRSQTAQCLVLGYVEEAGDLRSLVLAAPDAQGKLGFVGKCGSGFDDATRRALLPLLRARASAKPLIPCAEKALWVEPSLFCTVKFVERTKSGHLRAPVFVNYSQA
jgi:bifunctional non-homologous end joining protein LigD